MKKRVCYKCKIEKDLLLFPSDQSRASGFGYVCKECNRNIVYEKKYGKPRVGLPEPDLGTELFPRKQRRNKIIPVPIITCGCEKLGYKYLREHPCTHNNENNN